MISSMHRQITYMKDLNYYLSLPYRMELTPDKPEGDFVVSFPALPGCLSCGETIEEAITLEMMPKWPGLKPHLNMA